MGEITWRPSPLCQEVQLSVLYVMLELIFNGSKSGSVTIPFTTS